MTTKPVSTGEIREAPLADALGERYLAYALSTIMARSLPDVRDGLKPVHRRLLFAMRQLKLDPGSGYKKSARVVGDVIGKYHPHGDQSVYDALVRLAQDFSQRYPLIDGQGNFGNVDGDNPAAMRYTEARLTRVSERLLEGIDEDSVDFRATYDGEEQEPVVLPSAFPNLLANGATGIAVGMATSIPPHNAAELIGALLHLIEKPDATTAELVQHVPGPDFPTGGIMVESPASILDAYETGRGGFRLRARWEIEEGERGAWHIVITEIPYHVQKSKLIEKIAELIEQKRLTLLDDVRDESTDVVRVVLEPKTRTVEPAVLMESLFRLTDLETRFPLNLNVLDADGTPKVMGLKQALQAFLDHRIVVLLRRSRYRLDQIARRLEMLGGYLIAYLNLDEVIRIIREEDEPKKEMIARFGLTDVQAEGILNMRLRSLRRLEEFEIRKEHDALSKEQADLERLVADPKRQRKAIAKNLDEVRTAFGTNTALGRRRTTFGEVGTAVIVPITALVEREPITVVLSAKGWVRALKGHVSLDSDIKYKEGDSPRWVFHAETTDRLVLFATNGRFYTLPADKLPGGRGNGEPVRLMIELGNEHELISVFAHRPGAKLLLASEDGYGFIVDEEQVLATNRTGKQVLNVGEGREAKVCIPVEGDTVAVVGNNHKLLLFPVSEVPEMARGKGVMLQKYKDATLSDLKTFTLADGLTWPWGDRVRTETNLTDWLGTRAQTGRLAPKGFPKSDRFS